MTNTRVTVIPADQNNKRFEMGDYLLINGATYILTRLDGFYNLINVQSGNNFASGQETIEQLIADVNSRYSKWVRFYGTLCVERK